MAKESEESEFERGMKGLELIGERIDCIIKQRDALLAALIKYGMHLDDCPCFIPQGKWEDNDHHTKREDELNRVELADGTQLTTVKCICGFEQAIAESKV